MDKSKALERVDNVINGKCGVFISTYQLGILYQKLLEKEIFGVTFEHGKFANEKGVSEHTIEILPIDGNNDCNNLNLSYSNKLGDNLGSFEITIPLFDGAECSFKIKNDGGGGGGIPGQTTNPKPQGKN